MGEERIGVSGSLSLSLSLFFSETIPETAFEREFRSLLFNAFEIYKEELDVINVMNELLV